MLSPDYLENLPDAVVELWQNVEDDILKDVARRLKAMDELDPLTPTAIWQAWRLEQVQAVRQDVIATLAKYSGRSQENIRQLLLDAGLDTLAVDDEIYRAAGLAPIPVHKSETLNNLLNAGYRQTLGTWKNLTATTAATVTGEFERALDRAWLQVASGAFDYKTAIKRAVDGLAEHMAGVTYPSGHKDTLEVAVRRAVLTGVNQTCAKLQLARADEMWCGFVEVSAHAGARPEHAAWQGKVYHRGGPIVYNGVHYDDFETSTGYGTGSGLCGWNCRHNFYPFFPGASAPNYTDERLAQLNARDIEYNGEKYTRYEISQMQRALERRVRKYKRRYLAEDAAGVDTTTTASKLRTARKDLNDFINASGGRSDSARTSVAGFGHSQASKATAKAKAYAKEQERAILIEKLRTAGNLPKAAQIHLSPTAINVDSLGFDDAHINKQRAHGVTSEQAKQWIKDAKISITVWNGRYERYIGKDGAVYIDLEQNSIRTAFGKAEFLEDMSALVEEMKKNGLLG